MLYTGNLQLDIYFIYLRGLKTKDINMGFLSGAYGKLMAGKLVRQLQYQLTGVQSRLRRVTREVGDMEKMFNAQERNMKTQMQSQMNMFSMGLYEMNPLLSQVGLEGEQMQKLQMQQYQNYMYGRQAIQQQFMMAQNVWQDMFQMQRESVLQPLKDLEDDLNLEKDNLESRLKLAEQDYEAKKKEEQAGAKSFTPEYTSQA